jgi:hypothetical protein
MIAVRIAAVLLACAALVGAGDQVTPTARHPYAVVVDSRGRVFIADGASRRILRLDPPTGRLRVHATGLDEPTGLAAAAGVLYVADFHAGLVRQRVGSRSSPTAWTRARRRRHAVSRRRDADRRQPPPTRAGRPPVDPVRGSPRQRRRCPSRRKPRRHRRGAWRRLSRQCAHRRPHGAHRPTREAASRRPLGKLFLDDRSLFGLRRLVGRHRHLLARFTLDDPDVD